MSLPPHADKVFIDGCEVAERLGLTWWVSAGTALGLYRDGGFVPGDTDLDIACLGYEGIENDLRAAYAEAGFKVYGVFDVDGKQMQLALDRDGVIFDIYFHWPYNEDSYYSQGCNGKTIMPRAMYDKRAFLVTPFGELPFPGDIEGYLEARYGDDWRIPQDGKKPTFT